jgi:hypothetical protein
LKLCDGIDGIFELLEQGRNNFVYLLFKTDRRRCMIVLNYVQPESYTSKNESVSILICEPSSPPVQQQSIQYLWTPAQLVSYTSKNEWLECKSEKLGCKTCHQVKSLGSHCPQSQSFHLYRVVFVFCNFPK